MPGVDSCLPLTHPELPSIYPSERVAIKVLPCSLLACVQVISAIVTTTKAAASIAAIKITMPVVVAGEVEVTLHGCTLAG